MEEQKVHSRGRGRGRGRPPQTDCPLQPAPPPEIPPEIGIGQSCSPFPIRTDQQNVLSQGRGRGKPPRTPCLQIMKRPSDLPAITDENKISVIVNYFRLKFKNISIYHYDIDINESRNHYEIGKNIFKEGNTAKEDIKKNVKHVEHQERRSKGKMLCRKIISKTFSDIPALKQFCPVYDGQKNLFTCKPLPIKNEPYNIQIKVEDKIKTFFINITPVLKKDKTNVISLEPLVDLYHSRRKIENIPYDVLLVYDTILKQGIDYSQQVEFRNSIFSKNDPKDPLGCGLEIWFGHHQNVQLTESGPVVVINLAAKAFHKAGPVIEYANDVLGSDIKTRSKLENWQISRLNDSLKGVRVAVTHQKYARKYKIKSVMNQSCNDIIIDYNNKKISVTQYFWEKYNKRLSYPHLPCLLMQTNTNNVCMPMETCEVIGGQPKIGKLNPELSSKMIRGTAVVPQKRMDTVIKTAVKVSNINRDYMQAFDLIMDIRLTKVDGRILVTPHLAYAENGVVKPDIKGVWRIEDGKKFFKVVNIEKWILISFADKRQIGVPILSKYCEFLCKSARKCGMQLGRPLSINIYDRDISTEQALTNAKRSGAQFAIVVLNRRDKTHTYDEVKFLADFKLNLVTQCVEDKTLFKINDQITTNICLKINVKLGGINHILLQKSKIFSVPVSVLGIDVIHWPRYYRYPSIVSVVGSLNPTATRYALTCDLQNNEKNDKISQEIIIKMDKIAEEILTSFLNSNNRPPEKLIIFRDGVSEGQFQSALEHEVSGIQKACKNMFDRYIPITFIVVQKRHHTRFFPANPSQGIGRNKNVPPGTCVDREITHPVFFDYFICSHEGIQGTSKPSHYTILHDDNNFKTQELQELCYFLCHTYVRCTRSVSLPAPIMYADLAAARAKKYADLFISRENASISSDDDTKDLPPQVEEAIKSMKSFNSNMFYI